LIFFITSNQRISRKFLGGIHIRTSTQSILSAAQKDRNQGILVGFTGLMILILVIFGIFNKMVNQPVNRVLNLSGKMGQGDFTQTVSVNSKDEISHLCVRINIVN